MPQDLKAELAAAGLDRLAAPLAAAARPAIRLLTVPADGATLRARATRIGGAPDLRPDAVWPERDGRPLAFLAQIDLASVHRQPAARELPAEGLLQFFFDLDRCPRGTDPGDRGSAVVRLEPRRAGTVTRRSPAGVDALRACAVTTVPEITLPPPDSAVVDALEPDEAELAAYAEFFAARDRAAAADGLPQHRLLGHPSPLAGDMQLDCQLVTHGIRCGRPDAYADPRAAGLALGAPDWRLLLQLDTDDAARTAFGARGRWFVWMQEAVLRRGEFERVWAIVQGR